MRLALLQTILAAVSLADGPDLAGPDFIMVKNAERLPARLRAQRIPLGVPGDYKPSIARLRSGDLLVVAFASRNREAAPTGATRVRPDEYLISFRSKDGGLTWSSRKELKGL